MCGRFGPMAFATLQSRRCSKIVINGVIISAVDANVYKVRFQSGEEHECNSCKLKVLSKEDIPPSLRPSNNINDDNDTKLIVSPQMLLLH